MAIRYETFGPFQLKVDSNTVTKASLDAFWKGITKGDGLIAKLPSAIGVYLVAKQTKSGLLPWYVGKTDKGFKTRFGQHLRSGARFIKPEIATGEGDWQIFFLVRMSPSGAKFRTATRPGETVKSIKVLEFNLIADCLKLNPNLLNLSNVTFHRDFVVPGYLNDGTAPQTETAKAFAKMMKKK